MTSFVEMVPDEPMPHFVRIATLLEERAGLVSENERLTVENRELREHNARLTQENTGLRITRGQAMRDLGYRK